MEILNFISVWGASLFLIYVRDGKKFQHRFDQSAQGRWSVAFGSAHV